MAEKMRVLLPGVLVGRDFVGEQGQGSVTDLSIYPLVVEELIGFGVTEFAVVKGTEIESVIPKLPQLLRKRVKVIDPSPLAESVEQLFSAVHEELDLKLSFPKLPFYGCSVESLSGKSISSEMEPLISASAELYPTLFRLLIGMNHGLHVEMELPRVRELVDFLLASVRSTEARGSLTLLNGVLNSYQANELESVQLRSSASRELVNVFEELLEDRDYIDLSAQSHALGYPRRSAAAITSFGRSSRNLLRHSRVRGALEYAARWIEAALNVPEPAAQLIDTLSGQKYLPPVFSSRWVSMPAQLKWARLLPDPIPIIDVGLVDVWGDATMLDADQRRFRKRVV